MAASRGVKIVRGVPKQATAIRSFVVPRMVDVDIQNMVRQRPRQLPPAHIAGEVEPNQESVCH